MNPDTRNLILATCISVIILLVYSLYFAPPESALTPDPTPQTQSGESSSTNTDGTNTLVTPPNTGIGDGSGGSINQQAPSISRSIADIINAPRLTIDNPTLAGSLSLAGGRIDDLRLKDFKARITPDAPSVSLLRRSGTEDAYFTEAFFTRLQAGQVRRAIARDAIWQVEGSNNRLTPQTPLTLAYNQDGVMYRLVYTIDDLHMMRITAMAENLASNPNPVEVGSSARILRQLAGYSEWISYAGPMGYFNQDEGNIFLDYDDIDTLLACQFDSRFCAEAGVRAWAGISDKDWLTAIIPLEENRNSFVFRPVGSIPDYDSIRRLLTPSTLAEIDGIESGNLRDGDTTPIEVSVNHPAILLRPGESISWRFDIFLGPKKYTLLDAYQKADNIPRFTNAIDWGWMEFIAKPMLIVLVWLNSYLGNFGLAILVMTVGIKVIFFPLANRSYHSMAKMRDLAPKVKTIREQFSNDRQRQQQEMMALYRDAKVNPAAGCLPILLQIPVFFALYKVLYVTIEMRHAPFFGWVTDLSAADPTSILNLFGLLPYSTAFLPEFINIGVWPILMGISLFLQMAINPPPPDPVQAQVFRWLPVMFTFLLATFPVGLVIYWTWNNLLSVAQQWFIIRGYRKTQARQ
ncbi:MAG: membrane protein insertase YidC [Proteobacteria bacterium]|nr:membrane protein insertase YidC [Pseudomonadota bacterium]